ncbi:dockerin type I domain-containing protein [Allorhodopirellula solitaria]|nr:dockerin type I domain-containing protein [Allorhodopirellula solitaria]
MLATLNLSGGVLDYDGSAAAGTLAVELVGANYRFTDTENITLSGTQAASCLGSGTMVVSCTASDVSSINIDLLGGTDSATIADLMLSGNLSLTAENVTLNGPVTSSGTVTINANGGSITDNNTSDPDIVATDINLAAATGIGKLTDTNPTLEVDSTNLDAATVTGGVFITDTAGGVALGTVSAGAGFVALTALNGAITDGNGAAVNLTAANGVNLTTTGTNSAIGTASNPMETAIGSLTATTNDGGIYIADSNGPGLIINSVLAKEGGQTPLLNGDQIVVFDPQLDPADPPVNPHAGTKDVSISAQGDILLNSVTAPDMVTISSAAGRILDINQASNNVLARAQNLVANGAVGQDGDAIESTVETFSANTTDGPIFLAQLIASTAVAVVAGGADNQVLLTSSGSSLRIKTIAAQGTVTVANGGGALLDDNGSAVNITGSIVELTGASGIGIALDPLETNTSDLRASVSAAAIGITPAASIYIDNRSGGLVAIDSVAASTNAGDVAINFLGGSLSFVASTQVLNAAGAALTFETTTGDVKLGLVDAGTRNVSITAGGAIVDDTNDAVVDLRGGSTKLASGAAIGDSLNKIDTDITSLTVTTDTGGVFISEADAFTINASATVGDIEVSNMTGNMTVGFVSSPGQVALDTNGTILDGNGADNNVSADTLILVAANGVGLGGEGLESSVNALTADAGAGGGLVLANKKALVLTSVVATGARVSVSASGNLTLGAVNATGQEVTLTASGEVFDGNGAATNVSANSATLNGSMIGTSGNKIETNVSAITAATTTGGIFLSDANLASLALTATALGQAADIDIDSAGSILLNTAIAKGDTVKLRADGSITDGNDPPPPMEVNIIAKTLDIAAPGGIGTPANPLEAEVDQVALANGGAVGSNLTFTGPLLLTEASLEAAGSGTLTFDAESITIENIGDNNATIAPGRSLVLRTPTGAIVFLDTADTIETSVAGTISIQAGTVVGSGAVAVIGNLKTAGGDILVGAERTITIGQLDAGAGDVTVESRVGVIVDGNGSAINVIAGTTTLSGAAPTAREAELDETFRIAEAAAAKAEAAAEQTAVEALGNGQAILDAEVATGRVTVEQLKTEAELLDIEYYAKQDLVDNLSIAAAAADTAALVATTAATAALLVAGPAQAIPLIGDAGTFAVQASLQVVSNALEAVSTGLAIGLTVESIELAVVGAEDTTANFKWNSARDRLELAIVTQQAFAESTSITLAAATKSAIVRDASERIRDQAILARDQANVIGTVSAPLGLDVSGVVNVTAGPTDSFLQVVGSTAVDLIQTTGSVTLISTGAISDADAGAGADILATGLRIDAIGGIGGASDPLETRVATINAANTTGGDIAIANTVGAQAALDITGISNSGGGNVIISNHGSTVAGEGITVTGPIIASDAVAAVTINSGSPLTIDSDITAAGAIVLTAADTPGAGDDLTVNSGATIESTSSSVTLRAGDNVAISPGSTIQASTEIVIKADFNDDAADTIGADVIVAGTLIAPLATIGVDPTADDDDTFTITPQVTTPIIVDAEDGEDTLNFIANGLPVTIVGNQITAEGQQPVTFNNFEFVNIINASGGGNVTLLAESGDSDELILTGTGSRAGTFTLNGGVPISFSGVDSFTFNAGDLADVIDVTPFATSVLPWNVAVAIDGGAATDQITYNNVAGLIDSTRVTATAPQAGHIDSPGVTAALNSQLVSFTNVEDIAANANLGEDETLIVNQRDTSAADTTFLLNNDFELVGLFNVDTENYVGLTLNGNGGDDTFEITPGTIPVFVDGGDPIGSTAGDLIHFLPVTGYTLEPGPENDSGGFVPQQAGVQRVSWDHIEEVSVTGGGAGVFLGTNGDDDTTIIARDSSTHAGADGVQDFTVSLNIGPSVLFLDTPVFTVNALSGDDDIVLQTLDPNVAVWDVDFTIEGATPGATTGVGQQGDVFQLETQGVQTVTYSPTEIDVAELSSIINFGGIEQVVYRGQGDDRLFMHGTDADDQFIVNPANGGSGSHRSNRAPTFDFAGADAVTATGGSGGTDIVIVEGTDSNDVLIASAATRLVTLQDSTGITLEPVVLGSGIDMVTLQANAGDDRILVSPDPIGGSKLQFSVHGDLYNASDRLVVEDQGIGNTIQIHQGPDQRSGSVIVGDLPPVSYEGIEYVNIAPLDADASSNTFGGTGSDGNGRIVVFHPDPFSYNSNFHNPAELPDLAESTAKPNINPGALVDPFGLGSDLNGDVDWYRFIASKTGTFQFKVLIDALPTLANGQPGLPGDGRLRIDMFHADGKPIARLPAEMDDAIQTIGAKEGESYLVRIQGATPDSINIYDISVADMDKLGPQIFDPDGAGPQQAIQITGNSTYNIFDVKPIIQGPTPLVNSLTINIQDLPTRFPGFVYGALDTDISSAAGLYTLTGDHNGIIPIADIFVVNAPVFEGDLATATIELRFDSPLPDDRYTLTLSDSIVDPSGSKLDGESNAQQPQGSPTLPSGDTVAGGDFIARFTVDSRAELGVYAKGSVYIDTNGNNLFDPEATGSDDTNEDIVYKLGSQTSRIIAGNFVVGEADVADGYDKLATYGSFGGSFRWLIDTNNNGVPDLVVRDPAQISGLPVAGNFDANAVNGDEVGLKAGSTWYLDTDHDFLLDSSLSGNMVGLPFVGDFDGDGIDDLGAWSNDLFVLDLSDDGIDGMTDASFTFGFPGVREIPFAADFNGDGLDDIGLWQPDGAGVSPEEQAEFYVLMSQRTPKTLLNDALFAGNELVQITQSFQSRPADEFVSIDPTKSYVLSGEARSGDGAGGLYDPANKQYFGFASYDIDYQRILPWHVLKYASATDTVLTADLKPGDTQVFLQNAVGWANGGPAHQRSLAWYGYTDSQGHTYDDYTYTRNVAIDRVNGTWGPGGVTGNVITLHQPWTGPLIAAGSAVRNATSGVSYNYAGLQYQSVPDVWTRYEVTLSGTGVATTQFRPGTAFIKPIVLANYQGNANNQIAWKEIQLHAAVSSTSVVERITAATDGSGGNEITFTPQPFGQDLFATFGDSLALPIVGNFDPPLVPAGGDPVEPVRVMTLSTTNLDNPYDVNRDGSVTALDALTIINYLNLEQSSSGESILVESGSTIQDQGPMLNVNRDGFITALDVLNVINYLNELVTQVVNPEPVPSVILPEVPSIVITDHDDEGAREFGTVIRDVAEGLVNFSTAASKDDSQVRVDDVFSSWDGMTDADPMETEASDLSFQIELLATTNRW